MLTILQNCTELREVALEGCNVDDISALKNLTNMVHLRVDDSKIIDFSSLGSPLALRSLAIRTAMPSVFVPYIIPK
jgi:Leucine-rich repeat (LRR) protein